MQFMEIDFGSIVEVVFMDYQNLLFIVAGVLAIVALVVALVTLRVKMKKQEDGLSEVNKQKERYYAIAEMSNEVIFDYDIKADHMLFSDRFTEIFGRRKEVDRFAELKEELQYVYKEDAFAFENYCKLLGGGKQKFEVEFRLKRSSGDYVWCYVVGVTLYDENNKPYWVVGKITNIDMQKREVEKLQFKAEMDAMTKVYNKAATKERINSLINNSRKQDKHALLIVDMDNFKKINDTFGHLKGDEVLKDGVGHLKNMFRGDDVIGRIGGDEFVVFMSYVTSRDDIENKARSIGQAFLHTYTDEEHSITVSASIGISIYPLDGENYEELLDKSDKALYEVKRNGKNGFCFYREEQVNA